MPTLNQFSAFQVDLKYQQGKNCKHLILSKDDFNPKYYRENTPEFFLV